MRRIFLLLMILPGMVFGQYKNIILDESASQLSEPSIAINPKNTDNIVVTAYPDNVYVSQDAGRTWTKSSISSDGAPGHPMVISDRKGNLYYFQLSGPAGAKEGQERFFNKIISRYSKDGGASWDEGSEAIVIPSKGLSHKWAATDRKGNLYLTWIQGTDEAKESQNNSGKIFFSFSKNRGKKWEDPKQINQFSGDKVSNGESAAGPMPAVSTGDKIFVTWAYNNKLYLDRSYDEGETWLRNDIFVTEQPGGWQYDIPGFQSSNGLPVLIADRSNTTLNGMIYLNWSDQRNGSRDTDIWFTSSHNGGDTWSSRVRVNDDAPGKHQFMSRMAQDPKTGVIYIVFYDRRDYEDTKTDVYLAYSKNGGRSFKNVKISEAPFMPESSSLGDYISIDAYDGVVIPVWTRLEEGNMQIVASVIRQEELDKQEEQQ